MIRHLMLLTALAGTLPASIVYSNAASDALESTMYSAGPYNEIGDQLTLGGTARLAATAEVEFFNLGSDGVFDAVLRMFDPGAPVGAMFLESTRTGLAITSFGITRAEFTLAGELLPDELIFTVEILNGSAGLDLGLNLYDPPGSVGVSSNQFLIVRNGSYAALPSGRNSNLFFTLTADRATAVPEPTTALASAAGLAALILARNSRRLP